MKQYDVNRAEYSRGREKRQTRNYMTAANGQLIAIYRHGSRILYFNRTDECASDQTNDRVRPR